MNQFPMNCWYMAGWASDLGKAPVKHRLLDIPIVLFRTADRHAVALLDRCPHRFAPLSRGKIVGDNIQCGYHGLRFNSDGQCSHSPFGLPLPPGTQVRSFPVAERDNIIWFWPGDPKMADPVLIPDFSFHQDPQYRVVRGQSLIKANYELVTDNLLDLTHSFFLHPSFADEIKLPKINVTQNNQTIFVQYDMQPYAPTPFSEAFLSANGQAITERDIMRWNKPAAMLLTAEMQCERDGQRLRALQPSSHLLTPETLNTCHYFWASGAEIDAPISDADHYNALRQAFDNEDAPMLEAVHSNMEGADFWDMRPAILTLDNAAIRARRVIMQQCRSEYTRAPMR